MAGARTAPDVDTRRCAIGLDLGAPLLEVARRGFHSTFSNQMGQLGGWFSAAFDAARPDDPSVSTVLHLADDLLAGLAARELDTADVVRVGLAVPNWLGWCDRHHIARLVDPHQAAQLVWVPTPMAAALATSSSSGGSDATEVVIAIDLDQGISASMIDIEPTSVREVVGVGAAPRWAHRADSVATVVAELAELVRHCDAAPVTRIVLVATAGSGSLPIRQTIGALGEHWTDCAIDIVTSRSDIARATVMLADLDECEIVTSAPRSVGVLIDDLETGRSTFHAIVSKNVPVPSRTSATFDLGPDDGTDVHVEVYEAQPDVQGSAGSPAARHAHRQVMTARLDASASPQRPEAVEVSFVTGSDGLLRLQPATSDDRLAWTSTWAPSSVVMASATPSTVAAGWSVARLSRTLTAPASRASSSTSTTRSMAPPVALGEALGRAERAVSRHVGRQVAIRSAMSLCGCADRDEITTVRLAADRLSAVIDGCAATDATGTIRVALDVARRALDAPSKRWYTGGTQGDITRELERVIEHLAIVIGTVTPAERNRLVMDAQLLGLDHDRARAVVDQLIDEAGVDSDGDPDELRDVTAMVVVSADGWSLQPLGVRLLDGQAALRVLLFEP